MKRKCKTHKQHPLHLHGLRRCPSRYRFRVLIRQRDFWFQNDHFALIPGRHLTILTLNRGRRSTRPLRCMCVPPQPLTKHATPKHKHPNQQRPSNNTNTNINQDIHIRRPHNIFQVNVHPTSHIHGRHLLWSKQLSISHWLENMPFSSSLCKRNSREGRRFAHAATGSTSGWMNISQFSNSANGDNVYRIVFDDRYGKFLSGLYGDSSLC